MSLKTKNNEDENMQQKKVRAYYSYRIRPATNDQLNGL